MQKACAAHVAQHGVQGRLRERGRGRPRGVADVDRRYPGAQVGALREGSDEGAKGVLRPDMETVIEERLGRRVEHPARLSEAQQGLSALPRPVSRLLLGVIAVDGCVRAQAVAAEMAAYSVQ